MPTRRRHASAAAAVAAAVAGGVLALTPAAPALSQTTDQAAQEQAPGVSPYARGSVPAYSPPTPITRAAPASPGVSAAPVGVVSVEGGGASASQGAARPVVPADPVYSDPDLAHIRNDPYSLSRHTATQAGGEVTPYAPPAQD